jgi:hypothetical protein
LSSLQHFKRKKLKLTLRLFGNKRTVSELILKQEEITPSILKINIGKIWQSFKELLLKKSPTV